MSKETEESLKKFNDWKQDIEWRAEQAAHDTGNKTPQPPRETPETDANKMLPSTVFSGSKTFAMPNMIVGVQESIVNKGQWQVWVNGKMEYLSFGPLARQNALKYADIRINGSKSGFVGNDTAPRMESGLPAACIFCGGRYVHRLSCPDYKTEGPKLPPSGNPPEGFWFEGEGGQAK